MKGDKSMKRILSVFIATLLLTCLVTTAYAAEVDHNGGSTSTDVKATYSSGGTASIVYSVDVAWGSMEFTYNDANPGVWNPSTHVYDGVAPASWTFAANANKITLINHSNTDISTALSYTPGGSYSGVTGLFSKSTINLATAVGVLPANAPTDSSLLTLSGALSSSVAAPTTIGSVTVTLGGAG